MVLYSMIDVYWCLHFDCALVLVQLLSFYFPIWLSEAGIAPADHEVWQFAGSAGTKGGGKWVRKV